MGDVGASALCAGQSVELVTREPTAAEIIADMVAEAKATLAWVAR
jgi:NAD(P)H-dependent flavin oxidoreductase YrpB (nitropropane dioxygenase family)